MLRFDNIGTMLSFKINAEYECVALYAPENDTVKCDLYLRNDSIPDFYWIDEIKDIPNVKANIRRDIMNEMNRLMRSDYFTDHIKRYEYVQKCFDIGDEKLRESEVY